MLTKHSGRDALVSVSLANLCLLRVWAPLLLPNGSEYFAKTAYDRIDYISILLNLALLASLFFSLSCVARSCEKGWLRILAQVTFLLCLLPLFDFVRRYLALSYTDFLRFGFPGLIIGASGFGVLIFLLRVRLCRYAYAVLLYTIPFAALTSSQALWHVANRDWPQLVIKPPRIVLKETKSNIKPRVIWIIFDEWDQQATFERRPPTLQLPNIDAFSREAFSATNAYPPAGATLISIPSLFTGSLLTEVKCDTDGKLLVRAVGKDRLRDFRQYKSLVNQFEPAGLRLAISGWFQPYSRLVSKDADIDVHWESALTLQGFRGEGTGATITAQLRYALMPYLVQKESPNTYLRIHAYGRNAVRDPLVDIVFLHYPIPHMPSIYDVKHGKILLQVNPEVDGYFGNLALVDKTLGDILADLNISKLRDRTTIILSSDHWWRTSPLFDGERSHRVPYLIQLAGERKRGVFTRPINTVHTLDLVSAILQGSIRDQSQLLAYFGNIDRGNAYQYDPQGYIHLIPLETTR